MYSPKILENICDITLLHIYGDSNRYCQHCDNIVHISQVRYVSNILLRCAAYTPLYYVASVIRVENSCFTKYSCECLFQGDSEPMTCIVDKGKAIPLQAWTGSQISRQLADGGRVVSPAHRPPLPPMKYSCYSFLLEA
jgi:hypothetical protein